MFFYVAKIFWFFAQPSGLLLVMMTRRRGLVEGRSCRAGRRLTAAGVDLLLLGIAARHNWLILPLEQRFGRADLAGREIDGIIVLGGAEDARIWVERNVHALNEAGERFTEALALARRYPKAKVVFTGGAIEIISSPKRRRRGQGDLRDLGVVESDRLLLETKARDTWENAIYVKDLVQPKPGERWLLVTSAWHMPRSVGVFRKAGFPIEPWPVDYRTAGLWDALRPFEAPADTEASRHGNARMDRLVIYRVTAHDALPGPAMRRLPT
jgi:uncharacterized SAM-binding protein YcdF (DUF218 family)